MNDINYSTYNIYTFSHSDISQRIVQNDCSDGRCAFIVADCGRTFHPTTFRVGTTTSGKPLSLYIVQKRFSPHYLAAVLNSIVGETMLFDEDVQPNKRYVNKTRLLKVKFRDVPQGVQLAIGRCNEVLQLIDDLPSNFVNARFFALVEKRFWMLQNLLVAEMYCQNQPAFQGVSLISVWMPYADRLKEITIESIALVYADMFKPDSTLRNKLEVITTLFKFV